jgi:hypothetical protein
LDSPAPGEVAGFDEVTGEEIVEERDLDSRTFLDEDGTCTTRFYDGQVNYRHVDRFRGAAQVMASQVLMSEPATTTVFGVRVDPADERSARQAPVGAGRPGWPL